MPVGVQRCLNVLVTEPIANLQGACTHVNQMGGVAVPLAALVGVAAGMASGLAPRRSGGSTGGDGEKPAASAEPVAGGDTQ